ncbi:hypothetical protein P691DRAFT_673636 [Macrolepiota fuliginosa MF-IS2]|uniref:Urea carboxylase n=1 Tax=Macrolepiota fuliginosa MF-IS2 TaxID=1400762 RepID=A0A9P5X8H1_9AGAR|nr:hypothetical protein P691DRAFT_673636 [Macrolepiota fuliginosa MF-IS2]
MTTADDAFAKQTLLVANRGEIAVRIIRTAKKLGLRTVSVYTPADAIAPHVTMADVSVALPVPSLDPSSTDTSGPTSTTEGTAYLAPSLILDICKSYNVTLVHPGYGFLSENAEFAEMVVGAGITWLGPSPSTIRMMGMKHEARRIVQEVAVGGRDAGLELRVVPGSGGLVKDVTGTREVVESIGLPVIFKASAGGGGLGMVVCESMEDVGVAFENASARAKNLFGHSGVFVERYFPRARHVEVQVFGDGEGNVVHMGERECSTQRRHQKVIEECPSPFLEAHFGLREKMCDAAIAVCRSIQYESAGTIEFLVDDETGAFYFLEMNTRIQVEHPVTEIAYNNLDLVEMMIKHGISKREKEHSPIDMNQATYENLRRAAKGAGRVYVMEGRVYAENPAVGFLPSPGLLQNVDLGERFEWLRVDTWISTGMQVTLHFDPLLCKIIVHGSTREEAILRFAQAVNICKIQGPPNNLDYLGAVATSQVHRTGEVTTRFLDRYSYFPSAMKVTASGLDMSIQDLPGRVIGKGIPRSGPMDPIAFSIGNLLVGNDKETEGIEIIVVPGVPASFQFFSPAVVAITGRTLSVTVNGTKANMWSRVIVLSGGILQLEAKPEDEEMGGLRAYLSIQGGFPNVPKYLGSKSTSMGLGGYQGRSLVIGDFLALEDHNPAPGGDRPFTLPTEIIPNYPHDWIIYVLPGPQDDEEFLTKDGIASFYTTHWQVSPSSNRMGIRLDSSQKIQWARASGGEGGAHPSNILDNAYSLGSVNVNGDTPVLLTNEGPDMGGYICLCTVAVGELWKLGQLRPGNSIQFRRVPYTTAVEAEKHNGKYMANIQTVISGREGEHTLLDYGIQQDFEYPSRLYEKRGSEVGKHSFILRQSGDSAILADFGPMELDFFVRARIQAFVEAIDQVKLIGIKILCPCIRSVMIHYDNKTISQPELIQYLVATEQIIPVELTNMSLPSRRVILPIVLDDPWSRDATERYMRSIREEAAYLPSNVEYLAKNNGLSGAEEALKTLVSSDWIVFGVGFYLACPFLVPIDPRSRLTGQKFNPSRTFTPRGAVGIAGPVAAIYPIESPGGYQLFGRSLPAWQTWGRGKNFSTDAPWLLEPFDQVRFEPVDIAMYKKLERLFEQGQYEFQIEHTVFSMRDYTALLGSVEEDITNFRRRQQVASEDQAARERILLLEWEKGKAGQANRLLREPAEGHDGNSIPIRATLFASVWKILCKVGDAITSAKEPLLVLEAMKSEISIFPGPEHLGKVVKAFGAGVKEGALVKPGDTLIIV